MAVEIPSTRALVTSALSQLASILSQGQQAAEKSFLAATSTVIGGAHALLYRFGAFVGQQAFVSYASAGTITLNGRRFVPLEQHGEELRAGAPRPSERARLRVTITVTTQGGSIAAGRQLTRPATGYLYLLRETVALDGATKTAIVEAVSDGADGDGGGAAGTVAVGQTLEWLEPLDGVAREVTVAAIEVAGVDAEPIEAYRARVLERKQRRRRGGATVDVREWGLTAPHIVGIYPYRSATPGTVDVYVEADTEEDADGIPTADQLDAVEHALVYTDDGGELTAERMQLNALPSCLPITRTPATVTVAALANVADPDATRAAVEAAVAEHLLELEPYIPGLSVGNRRDTISLGAISGIVQQLVTVAGGSVGAITLTVGGDEVAAYPLGPGEKAKLGSLEWI